jgi:hypothetical protein
MQSKYKFLSELDLEDEVINKLSLGLDRIVTGNSIPLRTPLGSGLDADQILSGWDAIFNAKLSMMNEELKTLEFSNRSKYGPRSIAIPWIERRGRVLDFFTLEKSKFMFPDSVFGSLHSRLRPITSRKASSFIKNNTSSGLPYLTKKGDVKDISLDKLDNLLNRKDECVLFTRTQEDNKTRTVWGYPYADVLNESRFYRPLLEYQKKQPWRSAIVGPEQVDTRITELIKRARISNSLLLSIDFSSYDSTVKTSLQNGAFNYIKRLFQPEFNEEIHFIQDRFNSIGLITPEGIWRGPHGVPSGSTFTNEVDSIVQYLIAKTITSDDQFDIQGDDGVYVTDDPITLKEAFISYGLNVNDEKSYISDKSVVYLQNLHCIDYIINGKFVGIYPTYRALGRIIYPERYNDYSAYGIEGSDFNSIRTISILENCCYHPLFKEFVEYVSMLDKYSLRYSQSGLTKYIQRIKSISGTEGILAYRRGDEIKGLNGFKTVKLLLEL